MTKTRKGSFVILRSIVLLIPDNIYIKCSVLMTQILSWLVNLSYAIIIIIIKQLHY